MEPLVGVIDYRTGNSRSFSFALDRIGVHRRLVRSPLECEGITHIVLPGVGAAGITMQSLREAGWVEYLNETVRDGGLPFLGVCVGLQVLFEHSEEGETECLGWIPGTVTRFDQQGLRVPHTGWNSVEPTETSRESGMFNRFLGEGGYFYFVNSYHANPENPKDVIATTDYGGRFASVVGRDNILATQFHVEKSGQVGLRALRCFTEMHGDSNAS